FAERRVFGEVGADDLDGHHPATLGPAKVHPTHRAAAEPRDELVVARLRRVVGQQRLHDAHPFRSPVTGHARAYGPRPRASALWGAPFGARPPCGNGRVIEYSLAA